MDQNRIDSLGALIAQSATTQPREQAEIDLDKLLDIGGQMASVMFNLAQWAGEPLSARDAETMGRLRKEWDAARALLNRQAAPEAPNSWHDAVLTECMRVDGCYHADDPSKTLTELLNWHIQNERDIGGNILAIEKANFVCTACKSPVAAPEAPASEQQASETPEGAWDAAKEMAARRIEANCLGFKEHDAQLVKLAADIRAMPYRAPAPSRNADDLNGGMHASIFVKVWGDAGGGDAGRIALANYAFDLGKRAALTQQGAAQAPAASFDELKRTIAERIGEGNSITIYGHAALAATEKKEQK